MMKKTLGFLLALWACLFISAVCLAESELHFSLESGVYPKAQMLEITCTDDDAAIHYTLDGSAPTAASPLYEGPIKLSVTIGRHDPLSQITGVNIDEPYTPQKDFPSAHVVRAAAILPDGTVDATAAGTYFVGYKSQEALFGDLPVISLMTDKDNLFDYEKGIFVLGKSFEEWNALQTEPYENWQVQGNFSNKGKEWERPVTVDFMMAEGEHFTQDMGMRIKGAASRSMTQKSIRLIAREEYGKKNIKYPLLPDNICQADGEVLDKYKSITLRNGANDGNNARIRDPFVSLLARGMEVETAMSRPVIGYINGEYWGIYSLTEEYSDNHLANHYGLDNENVITIKKSQIEDGTKGDEARFRALQDRLIKKDMADPEEYAKIQQIVDTKSMADYAAITLYIGNDDGIFHHNNWMIWRTRKIEEGNPYGDTRWRMMIYDSDYSSDVYGDGTAYGNNTIKHFLYVEEYYDYHPARLIVNLLPNEEFQRELILSLCDVRNLYFEKERFTAQLDRMTEEYFDQTNETFRRFGPDWIVRWNMDTHLANNLDILRRYFNGRYSVFPSHIKETFHLSNPVNIDVSPSDGEKGQIFVNHRNIPITKRLQMKYFPEYPITLTAQPEEGCTFVRWEAEGSAILSDPASPETQVQLTGNCKIKAVFE